MWSKETYIHKGPAKVDPKKGEDDCPEEAEDDVAPNGGTVSEEGGQIWGSEVAIALSIGVDVL